jgi:hypothetical protein
MKSSKTGLCTYPTGFPELGECASFAKPEQDYIYHQVQCFSAFPVALGAAFWRPGPGAVAAWKASLDEPHTHHRAAADFHMIGY